MPVGGVCTSAPRQPPSGSSDNTSQRPAIVKAGELDSMDRLGSARDCWAISTPDVDYSQRLVFSDEEDFTDKGSVCLLLPLLYPAGFLFSASFLAVS